MNSGEYYKKHNPIGYYEGYAIYKFYEGSTDITYNNYARLLEGYNNCNKLLCDYECYTCLYHTHMGNIRSKSSLFEEWLDSLEIEDKLDKMGL